MCRLVTELHDRNAPPKYLHKSCITRWQPRLPKICRNEHFILKTVRICVWVTRCCFSIASWRNTRVWLTRRKHQTQLLLRASLHKLWRIPWRTAIYARFVLMEKQAKYIKKERRLAQKFPNSLLGPRMASGTYLPPGSFCGSQVTNAATTFPVAFHQMFVFVCLCVCVRACVSTAISHFETENT